MSFIPNFNQRVTITSSTTWTCPAGVFWIYLIIYGGGAGGYFQTDGSTYYLAQGGGGGQVKTGWMPVTPGTTYTFTIGSGGTGYINRLNVSGSATAGTASSMFTLQTGVTTLSATLSVGGSTGSLGSVFTSTASLSAGMIIRIDNEDILVTNVANSTTIWGARGQNGTVIASHSNGAGVAIVTYYAFAFGGGTVNGGGIDPSYGKGGIHPTAARENICGGGGTSNSNSAPSSDPGGQGVGPWSPGGLTIGDGVNFGTYAGGGASWGPGGNADLPAPANSGGGGGAGANGGTGGAFIFYQAA